MDTFRCIEYLSDRLAHTSALEEVINLLKRGEKFEKIHEAILKRYGYASVRKLVDMGGEEVYTMREIMIKLEAEFFGSSPTDDTKDLIKDITKKVRELLTILGG